MQTLLIALGSGALYLLAYYTYGRYLARRIFKLDARAVAPSVALNDDADFVPTDKFVVFGHHFTSIAGTGPIVGPAIAVFWGWAPALLWVLLGSILMGAVHDFGTLVVSMRNRGQTVGEIAGRLLNPRVRALFLFVLFMALTIVLAIFGLVIALVFRQYPSAIFPCLVQIPLAVGIGVWLHRKGMGLLLPSAVALGLMYLSVVFGDEGSWLHGFNLALASWPIGTWVAALLLYSYVASVLPVWALLQPRDFINSLQLVTALGLVLVGLVVAAFFGGAPVGGSSLRPALEIAGPAYQSGGAGAPALFPFLFITIACGAISGFHCLVSSGTSSKQLRCETEAQFVGYGAMLLEGFLAVLVILACVAGLGLGIAGKDGVPLFGEAAFDARYGSWAALDASLGPKVGAFVDGAANLLKAIGLPGEFAVALMGVMVASFAATTLDSACRLQRYVVQELAATFVAKGAGRRGLSANPLSWLTDKHGATIFAVLVAFAMAAVPPAGLPWAWDNVGKGGMILWPMFGATNQLLGGLAFLVVAFWMWRRRLPVWFVVPPTIFMLLMPAWAMGLQLFGAETGWLRAEAPNWPLIFIAIATLALEGWMIVEAFRAWPKARGVLEAAAGEERGEER